MEAKIWWKTGTVVPDFFYTDCSQATLAHNTRENLELQRCLWVWSGSVCHCACYRPGNVGKVVSGGLLVLLDVAAMASLNVMPTRYLIQFTVGHL